MNAELSKTLDTLAARWQDIENIVNKLGPFVVNEQLRVDRHGGKLRLFYNSRPIGECKQIEKIEAVQLIPELLAKFQSFQQDRLNGAASALYTLDRVIPEFEAVLHLARSQHGTDGLLDDFDRGPSFAQLEDERNLRQRDANAGER